MTIRKRENLFSRSRKKQLDSPATGKAGKQSIVLKYKDYLIDKKIEMTEVEVQYIVKRMKKEGYSPKKGFWYHLKNEISESMKEKEMVSK